MPNGIPIIYETRLTKAKTNEWGGSYRVGVYGYTVTVRLVWNDGWFHWGIDTGDCSMWKKGLLSLPRLVTEAMQEQHDDNPRYYRLKEELVKRKIWGLL